MPLAPRAPSTPNTEEMRLAGAQGGDGAVAAAWQEREARIAHDVAVMQAGPVEHLAGMTSYHQGAPSVEVQMYTHGAAPPSTPDVGQH